MTFKKLTTKQILKVSKEEKPNQSTADTYAVPDGKKAIILEAYGSAQDNSNGAVKVIWDYGGAGEEVIWTMTGEGSMPFTHEVTGDGVKKLAIEIENGAGGKLWLSGYMKIAVET